MVGGVDDTRRDGRYPCTNGSDLLFDLLRDLLSGILIERFAEDELVRGMGKLPGEIGGFNYRTPPVVKAAAPVSA